MAVDLQGSLGKRIGPLPVWGYGAIAVALAWLWYWYQGKDDSDAGPSYAIPDTSGASGGVDYTSDTGINGSGLGGSGSVTPPNTEPQDNNAWYTLAYNHLVAQGYDAVTVGNALNHYLTGVALSIAERALVNMAVSRFRSPPDGVPESPGATPTPPPLPGNTNPGPNTPPPAPPPAASYRTHTVRSGETLWSISARYLGSGVRWREIYNLNTWIQFNSLGNPLIYPGNVLRIPG